MKTIYLTIGGFVVGEPPCDASRQKVQGPERAVLAGIAFVDMVETSRLHSHYYGSVHHAILDQLYNAQKGDEKRTPTDVFFPSSPI